jgi:preprotein translocase subunit SecE
MTPQDWRMVADVVIVLAVLSLAAWIVDYLRKLKR